MRNRDWYTFMIMTCLAIRDLRRDVIALHVALFGVAVHSGAYMTWAVCTLAVYSIWLLVDCFFDGGDDL